MAHQAPLFPADVPTLGDGRYVLVSRIGEGGMAAVYRCYDRRLRVWRAVKVLLPEHASRPTVRERFESEAHTMAPLEHPNLVRVYDIGHAAGLPFLVMELVDGGTLAQWTARYGAMGPRLAVEVGRQIVDGLGAVHAAGVVHRDVKPKNVLVSSAGICKLTDFGIAQNVADGRTRPGAVLGTLEYMAPEQRVNAKGVDARADVYGLGATLWHLLRAEDRADLFLVESDEVLLNGIPTVLHPVILKCVAYDRVRRYRSAEELGQALAEVLEAMPPDPRGAQELVVDLSEHGVEVGQGTFGDLEAMLDHATPRKPLPYTMPASDPRAETTEEEEPEWVDRTVSTLLPDLDVVVEAPGSSGAILEPIAGPVKVLSAPAAESPPVVVEAPPPHPPPPEVKAPPVPPEPPPVDEEEDPVGIGWATWAAVLLFASVTAVVLVVGVAVALALNALSAAEIATIESRATLYQILEEEHPVVEDLVGVGADGDQLERAWLAFHDQAVEPGRLEAGTGFAATVEAEVAARVDPKSSRVYDVQLLRRRDRIRDARQSYERERDRWRLAAGRPFGPSLVRAGVRNGPPD